MTFTEPLGRQVFAGQPDYRICSRCVMDTSDATIVFDVDGVCNHCHKFATQLPDYVAAYEQRDTLLAAQLEEIRRLGKGRKYDCIVGVSGGVDSTYMVHLVRQYGLRALLVHMDNSWDSELAVKNVENIVSRSGFDYFNYVIDWEEFRDLQRAYFRAGVIDIEVLTDMEIGAVVFMAARKFGVRCILDGHNFLTESVMPTTWNYNKYDVQNLLDIHGRFGERPLRTFILHSNAQHRWQQLRYDMKFIRILNLVEYKIDEVMRVISDEFAWRSYGGKHWESTFTKYYQGCLLPQKFGVDKRRAHLTNMILSGNDDRDSALPVLEEPPLPADVTEQLTAFTVKKLGFSEDEYAAILAAPPVAHTAYAHEAACLSARIKSRILDSLEKVSRRIGRG